MFSLPNLPTDSLYKFLFLSGIVLFAISTVMTSQRYSESIEHLNRIDSVWKIDTLKLVQYRIERKTLKEKIDALKTGKKLTKPDSNKLKDLITERISLNKKYAIDSIRFESVRFSFLNFYKVLDHSKPDIIFQLFTSLIMIITGLIGWYWFQQKNQDELSDLQVKLSELEYKTALLKYEKLKSDIQKNEEKEE